MAKISFEASGREIVLRYDVQVIREAEEAYESMDALQKRMAGKSKRTAAVLDALTYMANAGERHAGREPGFAPEWFVENLSPMQLDRARVLIQQAIIVGNYRECAADDDREVDAVLEEIRKKKEKASRAES